MKNKDIHVGLPQCDVRDFLSNQLQLAFVAESNNKVRETKVKDSDDTLDWVIKSSEAAIEFYEKQIKFTKQKQSVLVLIKNCGWEEFDVSDETEKSYEDYYMNFIGTKEEYEILIKKICN